MVIVMITTMIMIKYYGDDWETKTTNNEEDKEE